MVERRADREGVLAERVTGEKAAKVGGRPVELWDSRLEGPVPVEASSRADIGAPTADSHGESLRHRRVSKGRRAMGGEVIRERDMKGGGTSRGRRCDEAPWSVMRRGSQLSGGRRRCKPA